MHKQRYSLTLFCSSQVFVFQAREQEEAIVAANAKLLKELNDQVLTIVVSSFLQSILCVTATRRAGQTAIQGAVSIALFITLLFHCGDSKLRPTEDNEQGTFPSSASNCIIMRVCVAANSADGTGITMNLPAGQHSPVLPDSEDVNRLGVVGSVTFRVS